MALSVFHHVVIDSHHAFHLLCTLLPVALQDLQDAVSSDSEDQTGAILKLTLCTLPQQQQHCLSLLAVFPSGFDERGAAAVLDWDEQRAHGLLSVLYRHGLVSRWVSVCVFCV